MKNLPSKPWPLSGLSLCLSALLSFPLTTLADEKPRSGVFTVAVMGEAVYVGQAFPFRDRGTFEIRGLLKEDGECTGSYKYQNYPKGRARYDCTNGLSGSLKIEANRNASGGGRGLNDGIPIEFVYGHSLEQTNLLLNLPGGRELRVQDERLVLVGPD